MPSKARRGLLAAGLGLAWLAACAPAPAVRKDVAARDPRQLMVRAMAAHLDGRWPESNADLEACLRLLARRPEIRLGVEAGTLLVDQSYLDYQGEPEELVFLHNLGMINYAMQAQVDEALVEARRSDGILRWLKDQRRLRADDPMARLLSAGLYASAGMADDARIDLEMAEQSYAGAGTGPARAPSFLADDLAALRAGRRLGPPAGRTRAWVIVYEGHLEADGHGIRSAGLTRAGMDLRVDGRPVHLELVEDLQPLRGASLRRRALSDGVRSTVRAGVRVALLAALVWASNGEILSHAAGEAGDFVGGAVQGDRRFWENLPARVYAARVDLKPGRHRLQVTGTGPLAADLEVRPEKPGLVLGAVDGVRASLHVSGPLRP